jgi:outer membrane receptor protein involved in Fe transport
MGVFNSAATNRAMANFYINYEPIDGLIAKINLGSDRSNMRRDVYNSRATILGGPVGGIADISTLARSSYLGEFTLDYTKEFNEDHSINALGGITYQRFTNRIFMGNIQNMPTDALQTNALRLGDTNYDNLSSLKEENTLLSYLARVNYTFRDKFLFTASIRADGSSRFGSDQKYGYFPSFALGYKLTDEAFVPEVFNELKLRASWGQTGNQEIGNYASQLTFGAGSNAVLGGTIVGSVRPARLANNALKWETTTQLNVGVDYGLFNDRITGTIDYFKKNTTDMLFNLPLPSASGYSSILSNIREVENSGIEFLIILVT